MKRAVTLILAAALILSFAACGKNNTPTSSGNDAQEIVQAETPTPTLEPTSPPEPEKTIYEIGETFTCGNWEITVTSFTIFPDKYSYTALDIKNISTKKQTFGKKDDTYYLLYDDKYEFKGTTYWEYDFNPLTDPKNECIFFYNVPEEVYTSDNPLLLGLRFGIDGEEAFVDLR